MEIRIGKSAHECTACARAFVHEEILNSVVRLEGGQLMREDYCAPCWNADRAAGAFSVWTPKFYDPKVADAQPPEVFSPLRQLFYEAVEASERSELAKAYLAAQLLRRQKVFRLIKESDESDGEIRVALFNDRIGNRLIEVRDPGLTYAEMESGRKALMDRLNQLENPEAMEELESDDAIQREQN